MKVYVITAIGVCIDTDVRVVRTEEEANIVMEQMFAEYGLDHTEADEMTSSCWKGCSARCGCDVEIEKHEKEI